MNSVSPRTGIRPGPAVPFRGCAPLRAGWPWRSRPGPCHKHLSSVGVAAGVKGFRVAGVEADGLRGVGDGLVKLAPARVGPGPVGVGGGEAGIGPDGLGAVGDSLVKLALLPIGAARFKWAKRSPGLSRIASVKSAMAL